jgi:hypothetical protein
MAGFSWKGLGLAALLVGANAPATAAAPALAPNDYGKPSTWLCRPSQEEACTTGLDAMVIQGDGTRTPQPFTPAADPPIDCFYVYPTVSKQPGVLADMTASPEVVKAAQAQAGRLASRCRLYVPLYRQMTLAGLAKALDGPKGGQLDWRAPYDDVLAAWRYYLTHDNHGRGVVLIGHSQGTILLQRLIAEQIDGKPAQARLVSAFLAGDPSLPVPAGATVGGVFRHVPLCTADGQTGCVYAWGSYLADDTAQRRIFGNKPDNGLVAGCVNPAAPGGKGALKAYLPKPMGAPESDPPWIEVEGQLSAACVADAQGNILRVSVEDSRFADRLEAAFHRTSALPGWGLHRLDINLVQGNILDRIDAQTQAWVKH